MARPEKEGLDYFSMDVEKDIKLKLVQAKFGCLGFGVYVSLLQYIYRNSFYVSWEEEIMLLFLSETGLKEEEMNILLPFFIEKGLFSSELFKKYNILTSTGIQKRYVEGTRKRKGVKVLGKYWLLGDFNHIIVELKEEETELKEEETELKEEVSTQSKVKESKVKESKVKELENFVEKWNSVKNIGNQKGLPEVRKINTEIIDWWNRRRKEYSLDEIKQAVNNYCKEIRNRVDKKDGYFEHRFSLLEFLCRKDKGITKFINL